MFGFINSFLLPFLFTAAIPILIHFFNKQKSKKIVFSSVRFLKQIENNRIKRIRLFQILLILVRTLFILFIVTAFTRPVIKSYISDFSLNAPSTVVFIIDDSYSMQTLTSTQTYFDIARNRFKDLLSSVENDDKLFLISSIFPDGRPIEKTFNDFASLDVQNTTFNVLAALKTADSLFSNHQNLNKEIFLISDFKYSDPELKNFQFKNSENLNIYLLKIGPDEDFKNISIDSVSIENQLLEINKTITAEVFLTNHSSESRETSLNLYNNMQRIASHFVTLNPLEQKSFPLNFTLRNKGTGNLWFEISEDDLSIDNSFYLSIYIPEKINVLLLSNNVPFILDAATDVIKQDSLFVIDLKKYSQLQMMDLEQYQVIVLNNPELINQYQFELFEKAQLNASFILIPGDNVNINEYNKIIERLCGTPVFSDIIQADIGSQGFFSLQTEIAGNYFLETLFFSNENSFSSPEFKIYLKQLKKGKPIIRFKNGDYFLSEITSAGNRPVYLFSSAFNEKWSDISLRGIFIPLLSRLFFEAGTSGSLSDRKYYTLNQNINLNLDNVSGNKVFIETPSGEKYSTLITRQGNVSFLNITDLNEPGVVKISEDEKVLKTISVNVSGDELSKPYITDYSFDYTELENNTNLSSILKNYRTGTELWYIFVILAVLMIAVEIFLIKLIEGR